MAEISQGEEIPPNMTLYINNLNEKIKIDQLKKSLHAVFSQFGKILDVLAFKTLKHKGQAWVIFEEVNSATNALRRMQGFPFYDKEMFYLLFFTVFFHFLLLRFVYGLNVGGKKRKEQLDPNQAAAGLKPAYAGAYGATPPLSQIPFLCARPIVPEAPTPPNNIPFVQNLPYDATTMMLQMLFNQYPSLRDVRMVETKPGIAFVEYENEMQSTVAMLELQGFKIQQNQMLITYAKR
ncbi:hypothetical protein CRYUN_Cryun20dG0061000 [Craigia yunnanensis]